MSLSLREVTFAYPGAQLPVLDAVSLEVHTGESVAVMAPSGAGKTTLLCIAGGLLEPDSGAVSIEAPTTRREVGWVLQGTNLLPRRSAIDNVALPLLIQGSTRAVAEQTASELLARMHVAESGRPVRQLSGGQAQRVGIARALASQPSVLLVDEPTANLDISTARAVMQTFFEAAIDTALLLATHDAEIAAMAQRLVVLEPGERGCRLVERS